MSEVQHRPGLAASYGLPIGAVGGLIGLGGAEFRLPVLKAAFGYPTHKAVALNLGVSIITLAASLLVRARAAVGTELVALVPVMLAIIAGSMTGAYVGAPYASKLS